MADHTSSEAPGLPEIRDEAAATPMWIPSLGLALFLVVSIWMVLGAAWDGLADAEMPSVVPAAAPTAAPAAAPADHAIEG